MVGTAEPVELARRRRPAMQPQMQAMALAPLAPEVRVMPATVALPVATQPVEQRLASR